MCIFFSQKVDKKQSSRFSRYNQHQRPWWERQWLPGLERQWWTVSHWMTSHTKVTKGLSLLFLFPSLFNGFKRQYLNMSWWKKERVSFFVCQHQDWIVIFFECICINLNYFHLLCVALQIKSMFIASPCSSDTHTNTKGECYLNFPQPLCDLSFSSRSIEKQNTFM